MNPIDGNGIHLIGVAAELIGYALIDKTRN